MNQSLAAVGFIKLRKIKIIEFKNNLSEEFEIKDIGKCRKIIGINTRCGNGEIEIDQKHLIDKLIKNNRLADCYIVKYPIDPCAKLTMCN